MNLKAIISADISQLEQAFNRARSDASKTAKELDNAFKRSPGINLNTDKAKRELRDLERLAGGSASGIRRAFSGVGSGLGSALEVLKGSLGASAIQSAITGVFDAMKSGLATGIEFNKTLETGAVRLRRFFGADTESRAFVDQLQVFAKLSPIFQLPEALTGAQRLLDMRFAAKDVIPALSAIGEAVGAVGGNAETIDRVTLALSQMVSKGKISGEEMLQLSEANIPAWELLAKAIGKTEAETRKLVEAGRIDARRGAAGIIAMAGEKFAGQSARAADTFAGRQAQFEGTLNAQLGQATAGSFEQLKKAYAQATDGLATSGAQVFATEIDKLLAKEAEILNQRIAGLASGDVFRKAAGGVQALGSLDKAATGLAQGDLKKAGEGLADAVKQGFNSGFLKLGDDDKAIINWFTDRLGDVKKALGIQSPSKVFEEIGAQVVEGFNLGLEAGKKPKKSIIDIEAMKRKILEDLRKLRSDPAIAAMLDTIASAEGADYSTLFGGGQFNDFSKHPNQKITRKLGGKKITSTAAGRYQFLSSTWAEIANKLGLSDFSTESQDLGAVQLMKRSGMIGPIKKGDIEGAFTKGNRAWASLPGSPYGQPTKESADLLGVYNSALEKLTGITRTAGEAISGFVSRLPAMGGWVGPNSIRPMMAGADAKGPAFASWAVPRAPVPLALERSSPVSFPMIQTAGLVQKALDGFSAKFQTFPPRLAAGGAALDLFASKAGTFADAITSNVGSISERIADFKGRLGQSFDSLIEAFVSGGDNWKRAALSTVTDIFNTLASEMMLAATGGKYGSLGSLIGGALGGLFSGFFKFGGGRASGGSVSAGKVFLVGEKGPELFTPKENGAIIPNNILSRIGIGDRGEIPNFGGRRAFGGSVMAGSAYLVGERGREIYLSEPRSRAQASGGGQAIQNISINFAISAPAGTISRETQSQIAARTAEALQHAIARNK